MRIFEPGIKTHHDENFPVASRLIRKEYRQAILAFYYFARAADDIADHPHLPEAEKFARLDALEETLRGVHDKMPAVLPLRNALAQRGLSSRHALDLLTAFRQDAWKRRYEDWNELMRYCMYSAAPVGRFVLDVHGEDKSVWPASDALCAALQVINHLQDCKADYLRLNRIYLPQDMFHRRGVSDTDLAAPSASKALKLCLAELVDKTHGILMQPPLSMGVRDVRLKMEIVAIEQLAHELLQLLPARDPLSEPVHLRRSRMVFVMVNAVLSALFAGFPKRKNRIVTGGMHACTGNSKPAAGKPGRKQREA